MTQMGHQQLLPQGFTFLAFLALIELFRNPGTTSKVRAAWWALFFSGTVAQIYASYYTGYFQCLVLGCALVVGLALPSIVIWAATVGSGLPLAAKRLGIDPAVMSAPFIATFVDATGLIIYFEIARRMLGLTF